MTDKQATDEQVTDGRWAEYGEPRSRTYEWYDPARMHELITGRSGLEMLQDMQHGRTPSPPIFATLGLVGFTVEVGRVELQIEPQEYQYNPIGVVHGGVISAALDTACACAVNTELPAGVGHTSLDLNVKFLRPVTVEGGSVTVVGTVLNVGRRTALAEAHARNAAGKLVAHATSSMQLFRPE